MIHKVKKVALETFLCALNAARQSELLSGRPADNNFFQMALEVNLDGHAKKLLLCGNTHPLHEDGHVIAVLNPTESLLNDTLGTGQKGLLGVKAIVRKRCDLMTHLWIDAYKNNRVGVIEQHKSRNSLWSKAVIKN